MTVKRKGPNKLEVEGCLPAVPCKGETWTRWEQARQFRYSRSCLEPT